MMRTIKLMKDHETPEGRFKKGESIEVDEVTYDWLMGIYLEERKALVAQIAEADKTLKGAV
jgi:hypothetical protein